LLCHNKGVAYENILDLTFHLNSVHKIATANAAYFSALQDKMEEGQIQITKSG
jgi:hypothetical protein